MRYDTDKDPLDVEYRRVEVIDLCEEREAANNKVDRVPDPVLEPRPETKPRDQTGLTREDIYLMFYDSEEDGDEGFDEDEDEDEGELLKSEKDAEVTAKAERDSLKRGRIERSAAGVNNKDLPTSSNVRVKKEMV